MKLHGFIMIFTRKNNHTLLTYTKIRITYTYFPPINPHFSSTYRTFHRSSLLPFKQNNIRTIDFPHSNRLYGMSHMHLIEPTHKHSIMSILREYMHVHFTRETDTHLMFVHPLFTSFKKQPSHSSEQKS